MNPTVVITGAARGIGAAIAERFARGDWNCVLVDLDPSAIDVAQHLAAERGILAEAVVADISSPSGQRTLVDRVPVGSLRALVNNAGITRDALITKMTRQQFDQVIAVNLVGAVRLTSALLPLMDRGSVVNLSSKSANGNTGQFNYAISKAGLVGFTRSMAILHAPRMRVNAIALAFIATEMTAAIPEKVRGRIIERVPFGRPGEPAEIADTAYWLASDEASYVTGQVIAVCGGRSFAP
jgi:3-oxoacyl-[acyl-carrier protein] reductase